MPKCKCNKIQKHHNINVTKYRTTKNKWDKCKKNNYKYEIIKMRQNRKEQNTNRTNYKCDNIQKQQNNNHKKTKGAK